MFGSFQDRLLTAKQAVNLLHGQSVISRFGSCGIFAHDRRAICELPPINATESSPKRKAAPCNLRAASQGITRFPNSSVDEHYPPRGPLSNGMWLFLSGVGDI